MGRAKPNTIYNNIKHGPAGGIIGDAGRVTGDAGRLTRGITIIIIIIIIHLLFIYNILHNIYIYKTKNIYTLIKILTTSRPCAPSARAVPPGAATVDAVKSHHLHTIFISIS